METAISMLFLILLIYLLLGILISLFLFNKGLEKLDEATADTGWGFKLLILPGLLCFWPIFLLRYFKQQAKTQ